jgi:predicted permease
VSGRSALIIVEVALSIVLLAGSGLMLRSLAKLVQTDPGFNGDQVLTARLTFPSGAMDRDSLPGFYAHVLERLAALPGVTAATAGDTPPLTGTNNLTGITLIGRPPAEPADGPHAALVWATPGWFEMLHISLKRGRFLTSLDRMGTPTVVLVNEAAARQFWPGESPIGKRIAVGQRGLNEAQGGAEVVGVIADVRSRPDSAPGPTLYIAYAQVPQSRIVFFLRTAIDPASITAAVRKVVHDIAPVYPVYDVQTMRARIATATAQPRFMSALLGLFSLVALVLAAVGIYGVVNVLVTERRREIGIRMAVGADAQNIVAMVVSQSLRVVAVGAVIGLVAALASTRVLRSLLFDVTTSDPLTYLTIVIVFGLSATLASWGPVRRAARVDPLQALRSE